MKLQNLLLFTAFLFAATAVNAQDMTAAQDMTDNKVPEAAVISFNQTFPDATQADWKTENNRFKVEFKTTNNFEGEGVFDSAGKLISSEKQVFANDVPIDVISKIRTDYPATIIVDVREIYENGANTYRLSLEENGTTNIKNLHFDPTGKILKASR